MSTGKSPGELSPYEKEVSPQNLHDPTAFGRGLQPPDNPLTAGGGLPNFDPFGTLFAKTGNKGGGPVSMSRQNGLGEEIDPAEIPQHHAFMEFVAHTLASDPELLNGKGEDIERMKALISEAGYQIPDADRYFSGEEGLSGLMLLPQAEREDLLPMLAFRGTNFGLDGEMVKDMRANFSEKEVGELQYDSNQELIQNLIENAGGQMDVAGYSLGGALGQRLAFDNPELVRRLVTFQSPGISEDHQSKLEGLGPSKLPEEVAHHLEVDDVVSKAGEVNFPGTQYSHDLEFDNYLPDLVDNTMLKPHLSHLLGTEAHANNRGPGLDQDLYDETLNMENASTASIQRGEANSEAQRDTRKNWERARKLPAQAGANIQEGWDWTKETAGDVWDSTKEVAGNAWDTTKGAASESWDYLKGVWNGGPLNGNETGEDITKGKRNGEEPGPFAHFTRNANGGFETGAGLMSHDFGNGAFVDAFSANAKLGRWGEEGVDARSGRKFDAQVFSGQTPENLPIGGSYNFLSAGAEASFGDDGFTLGASADVVGGSLHAGSITGASVNDHLIRADAGLGTGASIRGHWGDQDGDGFREYGMGFNLPVFDLGLDVKTEDPLGLLLGGAAWQPLANRFIPGADNLNLTHFAADKIEDGYAAAKDLGTAAWHGGKRLASDAWSSTKETAGDVWDGTKEIAGNTWEGTREIAGNAWDSTKETAGEVWDGSKEVAGEVWDTTKDAAGSAWEATKGGAGNAWQAVKDWF